MPGFNKANIIPFIITIFGMVILASKPVYADIEVPRTSSQVTTILLHFVFSFILTLMIELPIYFFVLKTQKRFILSFILINLITFPIVNYGTTTYIFLPELNRSIYMTFKDFYLSALSQPSLLFWHTFYLESFAILTETLLLKLFYKKVKFYKLLISAIVANLASFWLGTLILQNILP